MKFLISILKISLFIALFFGIITIDKNAQAHPGRTDSSGCHTCRTNCPSWGLSYGEYHCTGYTKPAPEYKAPQDNISDTTDTSLSESKPAEIDNKLKAVENIDAINTANNTDSTDSLLGTLLFLSLIGGAGYLIGKRKSSNK